MTKTETAIRAVLAALLAKSAEAEAVIPLPLRNEDVVSRMMSVGQGLSVFLNVLDGDRGNSDELLGADLGNTAAYEINQHIRIEWAVVGGALGGDERESTFDNGRQQIWDALKPDMTSGYPVYLGGAVDGVELVDMIPHQNTAVAGLPNIKACEFVFALSFTSADPF